MCRVNSTYSSEDAMFNEKERLSSKVKSLYERQRVFLKTQSQTQSGVEKGKLTWEITKNDASSVFGSSHDQFGEADASNLTETVRQSLVNMPLGPLPKRGDLDDRPKREASDDE